VSDLPDPDLVKTPTEESSSDVITPSRGGPGPIVVVLALAVVVIGAVLYLRWRDQEAPGNAGTTAAKPAAADVGLPPLGGNPFPVDVPPLNMSDAFIRQWVPKLSAHPRIAAWLTTDGLIRNFVTVVSNISEGSTPAGRVPVLKPSGSFRVVTRGGSLVIDERSFSRYDDLAAAFSSLDTTAASQLYATLKPRIEEAAGELGLAPGTFDRTLERAFIVLLQIPVGEGPWRVEPSGGVGYRFVDPRLESLSGAQKHLLRMGPANARVVQATLRDLAKALGIPAARLPAT